AGVHADDKDTKDKAKNIGEIMKKAHAGDDALKAAVTKGVKEKDFESAGTAMKAWVALSSQLGSFDPPKGEKESWAKLTKKYAADVKALSKAVDDKDAKEAGAKLKAINTGCAGCHTEHRPKKK